MLQTTAAAGGAAALGTGAVETPLTATQDAEAGVFTAGVLLGAGAAVGLGVIGGMALERWRSEDVEIDEDDLSQDRMTQTYEIATLVNQGFGYDEEYRSIAQSGFEGGSSNTFESAAWSEIRTTAVQGIQEDWSKSKAKRRAGQMVDKQATRLLLNHLQLWNRRVEAFYPYMANDINDSNEDSIYYRDDNYNRTPIRNESLDPSAHAGWEGVSVDGTMVGMKLVDGWDLPWDPTQFERWGDDEAVEMYLPWDIGPSVYKWVEDDIDNPPTAGNSYVLEVRHPDYDTIRLFNSEAGLSQYLNSLKSDYENIKSDMNNYIDTLYDAVSQGAVSSIEALSPRDLVQEFASAPEMQRSTAELAAAGLYSPKGAGGVQAKISHHQLEADSLWGRLFVRFPEGNEKTIEPNTTLQYYDLAFFLYPDRSGNGGSKTAVFESGDIEILDVSGPEIDQGEQVDNTVEDDGTVPVWDPETDGETPAWIKNPPAGETIVVTTPDGTYHFDPTQLKEAEDGTYHIPETQIPPGSKVRRVRTAGSLRYVQPYEKVHDPSTVDEERLSDRYDNISYFRDKVREETTRGGGGVGGDWISEIIGFFGGIKNAVIAAVIAVVGASVVGALRG